MNTEKTEHTVLIRGKEKSDEKWRYTKKLGTLLGDSEEIQRSKQQAIVAMNNMRKIFGKKKNQINLNKKIQLYKACITPILTYN